MRIGVISDIHGNLFALEAVLAELEREELDRLVCLGDLVDGPQSHEVLARIRGLDLPIVMGNWDDWFLRGVPTVVPDAETDEIGRKLFDIGEWWARPVTDDDKRFLATFRGTIEVPLGDGSTMFCAHGSPRSHEEGIFPLTPDEEIAAMLDGVATPLLVVGHTHVQMLRRHKDTIVLNPGSVGLPFSRWWPDLVQVGRWAEYAIVNADDGRLGFDLRRTAYDVDAFLGYARESGMPHADWWLGTWAEADAAPAGAYSPRMFQT